MNPTEQKAREIAKAVSRWAYNKTAGCSLSVDELTQEILRHFVDEPEQKPDRWKCKHCNGGLGTFYSFVEPKGHYCNNCLKPLKLDEPEQPDKSLDEIVKKWATEADESEIDSVDSIKPYFRQACLEYASTKGSADIRNLLVDARQRLQMHNLTSARKDTELLKAIDEALAATKGIK